MSATPLQQNRRKDLDIAKGIGIILVVWTYAFGLCNYLIDQYNGDR